MNNNETVEKILAAIEGLPDGSYLVKAQQIVCQAATPSDTITIGLVKELKALAADYAELKARVGELETDTQTALDELLRLFNRHGELYTKETIEELQARNVTITKQEAK